MLSASHPAAPGGHGDGYDGGHDDVLGGGHGFCQDGCHGDGHEGGRCHVQGDGHRHPHNGVTDYDDGDNGNEVIHKMSNTIMAIIMMTVFMIR